MPTSGKLLTEVRPASRAVTSAPTTTRNSKGDRRRQTAVSAIAATTIMFNTSGPLRWLLVSTAISNAASDTAASSGSSQDHRTQSDAGTATGTRSLENAARGGGAVTPSRGIRART